MMAAGISKEFTLFVITIFALPTNIMLISPKNFHTLLSNIRSIKTKAPQKIVTINIFSNENP